MNDTLRERYFLAMRELLCGRVGKNAAITIDDICMRCGITKVDRRGEIVPNRRVGESLLEEHIGDFGFTVVAGGRGYYRPSRADDINEYLESLQSRAMKTFTRKRGVITAAIEEGYTREGKTFSDPVEVEEPEPVEVEDAQGDLFGMEACG